MDECDEEEDDEPKEHEDDECEEHEDDERELHQEQQQPKKRTATKRVAKTKVAKKWKDEEQHEQQQPEKRKWMCTHKKIPVMICTFNKNGCVHIKMRKGDNKKVQRQTWPIYVSDG